VADEQVDVDIRGEDNLSAPADKASKGVARLNKNIVRTNRTAKGLVTGFARLAQGTAQFTAGMKVMSGGLSGSIAGMTSLSNGLKNMARGLTTALGVSGKFATAFIGLASGAAVVAVAVGGVTAAFVALGKSALRVGSFMEQARISLTTFTGSQEKATKAMGTFREFARTTPFALPEIVSAGKSLLAYQFRLSDVEGVLRDAGDAAAGTGRGLGEVTRAFGRLKGGDFGEAFERFRDFGIDLRSLRPELFSTGRQFSGTADEAIAAIRLVIQEGHGEFKGFGGLMSELATSWQGIMSMLSDAWFNFLNAIAEAGIFEDLKKRASSFLDEVNKLFETGKVQKWANAVSQGLEILLDGFDKIMPGSETAEGVLEFFFTFGNTTLQVVGRVIEAIGLIPLMWDVVTMTLKGVTESTLDLGNVDFLTPFWNTLKGMLKAFYYFNKLITDLLYGLFSAIVGPILAIIFKVAENTYAYIKKYIINPVRKGVGSMIRSISSVVSKLAPTFGAVLDKIGADIADVPNLTVVPDGLLNGTWTAAVDEFNRATGEAGRAMNEDLAQIFDGLVITPVKEAVGVLEQMSDQAKDPEAKLAFDKLKESLNAILRPLEAIKTEGPEAFQETWNASRKTATLHTVWWRRAWRSFKTGFRSGLSEFREDLGTTQTAISDATVGMLESFQGGLNESIGTLLFGGGEGDFKRGITALEKARDAARIIAQDVYDNQQAALTEGQNNRVNPFFETALDQDIGDNMKAKIRELQAEFAGLGVGGGTNKTELVDSFNKVIDQLGKSTGITGRLRRAGAQMKTAITDGFQENTTNFVVQHLMMMVTDGENWSGVWKAAQTLSNKLFGTEFGLRSGEGPAREAIGTFETALTRVGQGFSLEASTGAGGQSVFFGMEGELTALAGKVDNFSRDKSGVVAGALTDGIDTLPIVGLDTYIADLTKRVEDFDIAKGGSIAGSITKGLPGIGSPTSGPFAEFKTFKTGLEGDITAFDTNYGGDMAGSITKGLPGIGSPTSGPFAGFKTFKAGLEGDITAFDTNYGGDMAGSITAGLPGIGSPTSGPYAGFRTFKAGLEGDITAFEENNKGVIAKSVEAGLDDLATNAETINTDEIYGEEGLGGDIKTSIGSAFTGTFTGLKGWIGRGVDTLTQGEMTIGDRIGGAITTGMTAYAATQTFEQLTGWDIPGKFQKMVIASSAVFGAFGSDIFNEVAAAFGSDSDNNSILGSIKGDLGQAVAGAFIGAGIGSMFGPGGVIGGAIAGAIGQLVGGPIGGVIGGLLGGLGARAFNAPDEERGRQVQAQIGEVATIQAAAGGFTELFGDSFSEFGRELPANLMREIEATLVDQARVAYGISKDFAQDIFGDLGVQISNGVYNATTELLDSREVQDALALGMSPEFLAQRLTHDQKLALFSGTQLQKEQAVEGSSRQQIIDLFTNYMGAAPPRANTGRPTLNPDLPDDDTGGAAPPVTSSSRPAPSGGPMSLSKSALIAAIQSGNSLSFLEGKGIPLGSPEFNFARNWAMNGDAGAANDLEQRGWTLSARTGMRRVPGADGHAVPAILHGGESVLTASQTRAGAGDGGSAVINVNFVLNGLGDQQFLDMIRGAMPDIQRSVEDSLQKKTRLGQFSIDARGVRSANIN